MAGRPRFAYGVPRSSSHETSRHGNGPNGSNLEVGLRLQRMTDGFSVSVSHAGHSTLVRAAGELDVAKSPGFASALSIVEGSADD